MKPSLLMRVWRTPVRRKLVLLEALARTALAWARIKTSPFGAWRGQLGAPASIARAPQVSAPVQQSGEPVLEDIAWAHAWLARLFGAHFTCLMLALSTRAMLVKRRHESVLVLGVRRAGPSEKLDAHAWVVSRGYAIVGEETRAGHVPVAVYFDLAPRASM